MPSRRSLPYPPLTEGILIERRKRFLADVRLSGGGVVTAHTANTGRMLGCAEPGSRIYLSESDNPKRKHRHTWELTRTEKSLVSVNTLLANRLAALLFQEGMVSGFPKIRGIKREAARGRSRLDLLLTAEDGAEIYLEVKNCTLVEEGRALFPDAASLRAVKHLRELIAIKKEGLRAALLIIVAREDALSFSPADRIDPLFGKTLREAVRAGVEPRAFSLKLSLKEAAFGPELPVILD
ncbi:MAG: DNA/RNA nuclease SfsA [Deltaproteobacteria bacterium]|jgi:sugar fermentation stimulation protein A|nr:DNA/RNA nuclease SfsA [Deltaproteobacteria bacterium]